MLETVSRSDMWLAHTPQTFRTDLILRAHMRALEDGFEATDDAALVERLSHPVGVVEDSEDNIKITTPRDLDAAKAFLQKHSDHIRGS
jgi:2-C-methyl-D-erythritol 4-phosphate cytidylyltransferase